MEQMWGVWLTMADQSQANYLCRPKVDGPWLALSSNTYAQIRSPSVLCWRLGRKGKLRNTGKAEAWSLHFISKSNECPAKVA